VASTGCSLGATYAANFSLKYPEVFHWALCLSGRYDLTEMSGGRQGLDFYFSNPMSFVPNLEGTMLDRVRRETHLVLVCGQGLWENGNTEEMLAFARVLAHKGISHERDLWGHDVAHEWVWWRRQARFHLERAFGS
jgi:esterase/lipase superfamily enzyme